MLLFLYKKVYHDFCFENLNTFHLQKHIMIMFLSIQ